MFAARVLDVALILLLIAYIVIGYRNGFLRTVGALVGIIIGAVLAFVGIPLLVQIIPSPFWRIVLTVALAILLVVTGHSAGRAVGHVVARRLTLKPLRAIDRVAGAVVGLIAAALTVSLILGSINALGAPDISTTVGESVVLQTIQNLTPSPLQSALARVRAAALQTGLPQITEALGGVTKSPGVPGVATGSAALNAASASVVRIRGNAYACGQNQSGSGFVVAPNRIMTNAHVIAGVSAPLIDAPNGQTLQARVVYFNSTEDLAVLATDSLSAPALKLSTPMAVNADGVIDGYPFGGPFHTGGAQVLALSTENVQNIYSTGRSPREIYTLAADVEPGNSGGPLLTLTGQVAGVVFAQNADQTDLGYAISNTAVAPIVAAAPTDTQTVDSGHCTKG